MAFLRVGDMFRVDFDPDTDGRINLTAMPDGVSGQVLTGQGVGVDPVYAIAPGVPSGVIAMWHGLLANIPSGWILCDGANGTPNLLSRFVQGVPSATTNPGAIGGSTSKTTAGHQHQMTTGGARTLGGSTVITQTTIQGDSISDIRPLYFEIAFIMKT